MNTNVVITILVAITSFYFGLIVGIKIMENTLTEQFDEMIKSSQSLSDAVKDFVHEMEEHQDDK